MPCRTTRAPAGVRSSESIDVWTVDWRPLVCFLVGGSAGNYRFLQRERSSSTLEGEKTQGAMTPNVNISGAARGDGLICRFHEVTHEVDGEHGAEVSLVQTTDWAIVVEGLRSADTEMRRPGAEDRGACLSVAAPQRRCAALACALLALGRSRAPHRPSTVERP
ncbi:hypothetical protein VTN00DRAFT_8725 [Thermoascus crustaceus]|uniref:uncharacterized protein n=1 Tax=Thermoascus crustaceus TaxID=5088 RepID=UPI003743A48A